MKAPWFSIIDVTERRGRSMADIVADVAAEYGVKVAVMRSPLLLDHIVAARDAALARIRQERPDLGSARVAEFFNRDPSSIRYSWRRSARKEAA